jgi:hypothetical protein
MHVEGLETDLPHGIEELSWFTCSKTLTQEHTDARFLNALCIVLVELLKYILLLFRFGKTLFIWKELMETLLGYKDILLIILLEHGSTQLPENMNGSNSSLVIYYMICCIAFSAHL